MGKHFYSTNQSTRYFSYFLGLLLATAFGYFFLFPQVWYCQWVGYSDFKQIDNGLYISPEIPVQQRVVALQNIDIAQKRIAQFWGKQEGKAALILCNNGTEYQHFCNSNEGAGCSIGTPWGQSFVVLNREGLNADVIAHEMCHDELFTRLGWWKTKRQIPQWFNEGLALMADYRFVPATDSIQRYIDYKEEMLYRSHGGHVALNLKDISTTSGFFGGDEAHVMLAYMAAGTEVSRWLSLVGTQRMKGLIEGVERGNDFLERYQTLEKQAKPIFIKK